MNRNRNLIYLGLALLITACATPEPSPTIEAVVEQALPETTEIAETFTEVPSWSEIIAAGAVKDGWLAKFGDDELEQIVDEALQNNRELEGTIDFLSVLQMQARTLNSRISLIRLKNARLAQRVDLHLALGGDFSE